MTAQTSAASGIIAWLSANINKVKSVIVSVTAYVGTLQGVAALENGSEDQWAHFWDLLQEQPALVVPGLLMALISGWRTSSDPSPRQVRKAENALSADLDKYRTLKALDENGDH